MLLDYAFSDVKIALESSISTRDQYRDQHNSVYGGRAMFLAAPRRSARPCGWAAPRLIPCQILKCGACAGTIDAGLAGWCAYLGPAERQPRCRTHDRAPGHHPVKSYVRC